MDSAMHVPVTLEEWTYETVADLARVGRCEGERHDFKFNLPDADNLTKICCAFANSQGGFVVLGVKERSHRFLVEGIDPDGEVAKKFGAYRDKDGISERALFIVDKNGKIAYKDIHNISDQPDNEDLFEVLRKL